MSARATITKKIRQIRGGLEGFFARRRQAAADGLLVKVGLPKGSGTHPSGMAMVELGAIHEFGSEDGRIPERPFLRGTMKKKTREHNALIRDLAKSVGQGRTGTRQALEQLGARAAGDIQEAIADRIPPANAPSTIKRKGSSTPLIDDGDLRRAITHQVFKKGSS